MRLSDDPVLVGDPLRELLHVILDSVVLGVEDVDPVERGADTMLVNVIVTVPANVLSLVNNQTLQSSSYITITIRPSLSLLDHLSGILPSSKGGLIIL